MIVFLYLIGFIFLIIITLIFSSISIILDNIVISDINKLLAILKIFIKEKEDEKKLEFFNYIKINAKLRINIFNKIPINILKIDEQRIKRILLNQYQKEVMKNKDIEKEKKKAKKITKKLLPTMILQKTNLDVELGTDDAAITALTTSALNIVIAIFLPYIADINKLQNYNYKITPIYLDKNVFFLQFGCIITSKIVHIIKIICKKEEIVKNE